MCWSATTKAVLMSSVSMFMIVNKLTLKRILKLNTTFRPASIGLDHALVFACLLTQILAEGSGRKWAQLQVCIPDHDSLWGPVV